MMILHDYLGAHDIDQMDPNIRKKIDRQMNSYWKSNQTKLKPFDEDKIEETYGTGKNKQNLSLEDILNWFEKNQSEIEMDLRRARHYHMRPLARLGTRIAVYAAVGAGVAFAFSIINSRAGGYSAAVSEKGFSDSRHTSFEVLYGRLKVDDPERAEMYRYFREEGENYFVEFNKAFSQWSRTGKWEMTEIFFQVWLTINDVDGLIAKNGPQEQIDSGIRMVYFFYYAYPEFFETEYADKFKADEALHSFFERADPEGRVKTDFISEYRR